MPVISLEDDTRITTFRPGNSAEWIVEASDANQLPDYGQVFFHPCIACAGNGGASGGTGEMLNIVKGGSVISQATSITPLVIQCRYRA